MPASSYLETAQDHRSKWSASIGITDQLQRNTHCSVCSISCTSGSNQFGNKKSRFWKWYSFIWIVQEPPNVVLLQEPFTKNSIASSSTASLLSLWPAEFLQFRQLPFSSTPSLIAVWINPKSLKHMEQRMEGILGNDPVVNISSSL